VRPLTDQPDTPARVLLGLTNPRAVRPPVRKRASIVTIDPSGRDPGLSGPPAGDGGQSLRESERLLTLHRDELDEVAAGVVEHGSRSGAEVSWILREPHAGGRQPLVLGTDVVYGEGGEGDAVF
jgi:hypothetical protein